MKKKRFYSTVLLFVVISFMCGLYFGKTKEDSSLHKLSNKDIARLSSSDQFSGRIYYHDRVDFCNDVVPNETIAVKMGLLLLESIYGSDIYNEKPYYVALQDSVWIVETALYSEPELKEETTNDSEMEWSSLNEGGVGHVEINKHSGQIYTIYHTK